jgi:hypothetical protein
MCAGTIFGLTGGGIVAGEVCSDKVVTGEFEVAAGGVATGTGGDCRDTGLVDGALSTLFTWTGS